MPLMGFKKKKKLDRGVGGWVELNPNYFWNFFNFAKPLSWSLRVVNIFLIIYYMVHQ